jgi:ankyrin repeat protein
VAAARHVLIKCGFMEIDGHAFCIGLDFFDTALKESILQVAFLIRGAVFRSRYIPRDQGRLSLDICSLGELVDMYHAHETTEPCDKVYALLGMCSDNPRLLSAADLEPDYSLEWKILMQRLVKFLLGDQVSVETWNAKELAVIKSNGCVLGKVSKVDSNIDSGGKIQSVEAVFGNTSGEGRDKIVRWTLRTSTKSIQDGDLICFFPGASQPTIARPRKDYFEIVMIAAVPPKQMRLGDWGIVWPELSKSASFNRDFLLVWYWDISLETFQDSYDIWTQTHNLQSKHSGTRSEGPLNNMIRRWNAALTLGDLGEWEKAEEMLHGVTGDYLENEHSYMQNQAVVKLLLETGKSEVNPKDEDDQRLLWYAVAKGHSTVVKLLLSTGKANVESQYNNGLTPLILAAQNGHEAIIKLLLEAKADVESKDRKYDQTPLLCAAQSGREGVVKLLLEAKADVESKDVDGRTPLSWAAKNGQEGVVKLLLEAMADVESKYDKGQTPLSFAAAEGYSGVVKLLLEAQADVESKDNHGQTPLLWAAGYGREGVVKLLLEAKADVELKDKHGETPLSWAARNGHKGVVKLLLESKDNNGETPLSWAAQSLRKGVAKLLQSTTTSQS